MKQTYTMLPGLPVTIDLRLIRAVAGYDGLPDDGQCDILLADGPNYWITVKAHRADVVRDWERATP